MVSPHVRGICDRCGFEYPLVTLRKEWTGLKVCRECYDIRHPQEFVRGKADKQAVADPRPDPEPVFVTAPQWNETTKAWE
jgi:ribosome-binding protein aMBF1 (putative translation factor)